MTHQIEVLAQAESDIETGFAWYQERSPVAAAGFLKEIDRGLTLILAAPQIWPEFSAGTQQYPLRRYPYKLIYQVTKTHLVIVAVAHNRRRPGYWQ